jgi:hypothetical protein
MSIIKEPADVDFVVNSREWSERERQELSEIIAKERQKLTPEEREKVEKLSSPPPNLQDHLPALR